jgi:hypothetical protein
MRPKHPDAFLLPLLLPVFVIGLFPLLILGVVGFLGIGVIGLLLVFIAVGDELDATGLFSRRIVTQANVRPSERAGYRIDLRAALRPASLMKLAGTALMIVGYGGFFWLRW